MFHQLLAKTIPNLNNLVWTPLALPLCLGAGFSVILTIYLLRRPLPEKARIGVLMLLAGSWWAVAYALELLSVGLNAKLLWAKIQYIGIVLFPIATLVMGILYTDRSHLLTRRNLTLLTLAGFIILLLVFTTENHHLFWHTISLNSQTVPPVLHVEYAPGFWIFMGYVSVLTWTGLGLMLFSFIKSPILHRRQIRIMIISVFVLVIAIGLNMMDVGPAAYLDLQPYAILLVCIGIGWGSYRLQLGDIVPVAYLAVIENIPDAVIILNSNNRILKLNIAAQNLLSNNANDLIGKTLSDCCPIFDEVINNQIIDTQDFIEFTHTRQGKKCTFEIQKSSVLDGRGRLASQVVIIHDITKLKYVEVSLRQLNEELEQRVAERTQTLSETNKQLAEEIILHQETEMSLVQRNRELLSFQAAATATSSSLDMVFVLETLTWEMIDLLEVDGCCVFQLVADTNELIAIADYAALIVNAPIQERRINLNKCELYNRVIKERFAKHITKSEIVASISNHASCFDTGFNANNLLLIPMIFQDRVVGLVELTYEDQDRELSERQISLGQFLASQAAIALENANLYNRAQQEILERQRAEVQIKTSLKEKEMLLQEIHHRVKNNLQVISSLLSLQSRNVDDEETLTVLRESQDRIRSMALIHEKLYRSENFARIDFAGYLQSLTSHLVRSYRSSMGIARLQMDVADVSLSLETAVPCGLIVNELVSNALKHAFSDGRQGTIHITLSKDQDKQVSLSVADDGVGLPKGFDIQKSDSLGLRLVTMLVGQVRGELITTNDRGTKFEVVFPGE